MAAPRLCKTKSFPGGKPWQVEKGGIWAVPATELAAEKFLPCPLPITTQASSGCSGSSKCPVLDIHRYGKVTPPSHLSPEQQKDQHGGGSRGTKPSKQHLGLIRIQDGFTRVVLKKFPTNSQMEFSLFSGYRKGYERKNYGYRRKQGQGKGRQDLLGGTFRCGHEGPCGHQQQPKPCSPKLLHFLVLLAHTSQNTPWDFPAQGTSWNHSLNKTLGECDKCWQTLKCFSPDWPVGAPSSYSCSVLQLNSIKADGKSFNFPFNLLLDKISPFRGTFSFFKSLFSAE